MCVRAKWIHILTHNDRLKSMCAYLFHGTHWLVKWSTWKYHHSFCAHWHCWTHQAAYIVRCTLLTCTFLMPCCLRYIKKSFANFFEPARRDNRHIASLEPTKKRFTFDSSQAGGNAIANPSAIVIEAFDSTADVIFAVPATINTSIR